MRDITQILSAIDRGDATAADELLPLVYAELRRLAASKLSREEPGQTLQATELVHEAYVRLVHAERPQQWNGRGHFFGAAAESMRRILVERARRKLRKRHGGGRRPVSLEAIDVASEERTDDLLSLNEVLKDLEEQMPDVAKLVILRYFGGLTIEEAADSLAISVRTANRHWAFAKAWIFQQISSQN
jgi:RNA polymerase sigma factor (TIGR02999 family)